MEEIFTNVDQGIMQFTPDSLVAAKKYVEHKEKQK